VLPMRQLLGHVSEQQKGSCHSQCSRRGGCLAEAGSAAAGSWRGLAGASQAAMSRPLTVVAGRGRQVAS